MKTAFMLAAILCAGSLGAQTPKPKIVDSWPMSGYQPGDFEAQTRPDGIKEQCCKIDGVTISDSHGAQTKLTEPTNCGAHEHLIPADDRPCNLSSEATLECSTAHVPARCADDVHQVTEKEWQELMVRLKTIEGVIYYPIQARPQTGMPMIIRGTSVLPVQGGSTESQPLQKQTLPPSQKPVPEPKKN